MSKKTSTMPNVSISGAKKHNWKNPLEESVFKATQSTTEKPPKQKHIQHIVQATYTSGPYAVFSELFSRPVAEKEMILFKTLFLFHTLLREGNDKNLSEGLNQLSLLKSLHGQIKEAKITCYVSINLYYLQFLCGKLNFHNAYPEIEGTVDVLKFQAKRLKVSPKWQFNLCSHLIELQKSLLTVEQKILNTGDLNECKVIPIGPILYESFNIYNFTVSLLKSLAEYEGTEDLTEDFNKQFPFIQKFYFQCTTIPYISRLGIKIPVLGEIPVFSHSGPKKKMKTKSEKPQEIVLPEVKPLADLLGFFPLNVAPIQIEQPPSLFQSFQGSNSGFKPPERSTVQPGVNPFAKPVYIDPFPPEDREALKRRIRELEQLIKELEQKIKEVTEQNADFRLLLGQRDNNISAVRASMEQRLNEQQQKFMKENQILKDELDSLMAQHAADKKQFLQQITSRPSILPNSHLQSGGSSIINNALELEAQKALNMAGKYIQSITSHLSGLPIEGQQKDFSKALVDASVAISHATGSLVGAASNAQTERLKLIDLGLAPQRDDIWTDSLLNAAKSVANAVNDLSNAATAAAKGEIDEAQLVAAARNVASATSQLITAFRAGGEGSEQLDRAAESISIATMQLVESARLVMSVESRTVMQKSAETQQQVEEEIERSAQVFRAQKQLEAAEKKLAGLRAKKQQQ